MRYYEARSTIAASAEAVWAVLIDGASWPKWDSGVDAVEGRIAMGETLKIRSQAAPGRHVGRVVDWSYRQERKNSN